MIKLFVSKWFSFITPEKEGKQFAFCFYFNVIKNYYYYYFLQYLSYRWRQNLISRPALA